MMRHSIRLAASLCLVGALAGCHETGGGESGTSERTASVGQSASATLHVDWGHAVHELAASARGFEQVAEGPSAIALDASGRALLLDRLAGRIVRLSAKGVAEPLATVPADAEDLAVGPDGAIVAYSPLRARAWIFEADGSAVGEVAVPRALREVLQIELGPSRVVRARTGYQEIIDIGSPSAPLPLPVVLASKREGALLLPDGRGLSAVVADGQAHLWIVTQSGVTGRSSVVAQLPIAGPATAARLVGVSGSLACLRIEHASTPAAEMVVERRAVCIDVNNGTVALEQPLPRPGLYLPRRELAVGGGYLAFMHPTDDGLDVQRFALPGNAAQGQPGHAEEVQP